jgi:FKBP-type peptidyl-prolyl cis-trans isomerase FkpA
MRLISFFSPPGVSKRVSIGVIDLRDLRTILIAGVIFSSCGKLSYKKAPGGFPYKVFSNGKGEQIKPGSIIKLNIENKVNDSVYNTTFGKQPAYIQAQYMGQKYDISEIWTQLRNGDSVVAVQSLDTFIKRNPDQLPPEIKKGDRLIVTLKILGVFKSDSAAKADQQNDTKILIAGEKEALKQYFKDNKIEGLQETPSGAFVKIINPGTGNLIDSGNYVTLMYRGRTLAGKIFDTNMDSSFGRTDPMPFTVDVNPMIKGFIEGLKFMRKGAEAKVYIPSMLAYGPEPQSQEIKPYEHLVFDIIVTDLKDKAPEPPALPQVQKTAIDSTKK